jgi:CsbD-like.
MTHRHDVVKPTQETGDDVRKPGRRNTAMTDERVKGTLKKTQGKVEEGLGKVTGNKEEQVRGKARQVQGSAQEGLGDIQNAVRKPSNKR